MATPPLNQVEIGMLEEAFDQNHMTMEALTEVVQTIVDNRYTEKFHLEFETVDGVRRLKVTMGDNLIFEGAEFNKTANTHKYKRPAYQTEDAPCSDCGFPKGAHRA